MITHPITQTRRLWPLLVWLILVAGCSSFTPGPVETTFAPTPTTPTTGRGIGDTLRLLYWETPEILNPHLAIADKDLEVSRITYEPLASFDKDGELVPVLGAEIPSLENGGVAADGKSVTWKLKQGIKWSDGQPFTAQDVKFTYDYIADKAINSGSAGYYENVAGVEVIDDYTVKVNFKDVTPAWAVPFVGLRGMIIPRHIFEPYMGEKARQAPANTMPVGTGPYQIVAPGIKPQEVLFVGNGLIQTIKIVYEPNPDFREADKPYFSRVEVQGGGVVNEAARAALRSGEVDFAYNLQVEPPLLAKLAQDGQGYVLSSFGARVEQIALNQTDPNQETTNGELSSLTIPNPYFKDKRVRQALAYAIDRPAIAKLYDTTGRLTTNNLVAPANFYSPNVFYEYNPEKARALLEEAGWIDQDNDGIREKDGRKLKLVSKAALSTLLKQSQQIIQKNLRDIGIDVDVQLLDPGDFYSDPTTNASSVLRSVADIQEFDISTSSPDPAAYMAFWTCAQIPQMENNWSAGLNVGRWCNHAYDDLLTRSSTELDPQKREQLFIQMNDMQVEDVAMIPLVHLAQVSGVNNNIQGLDPTPWDGNLWNLKDWRRVTQ
jgi:peptide/nickel transport system substrate-binding protein